jgi:hypothetical protein
VLTTPHCKNVSCYKIFTHEFKQPLAPEPSAIELELEIEKLKLKSHKSQGTDQIQAEIIK